MEAHKVILATASPFFLNMHPHPLVNMRGVKPEHLASVINFVYDGEAHMYQENLNYLLDEAKKLNLNVISDNKTFVRERKS